MSRQAKNTSKLTIGTILLALLYAAPSHAYLDPGTGSILVQSILAGIAVAIGVVRMYWYRLKAFFAGNSSESGQDSEQQLTADDDAQHES